MSVAEISDYTWTEFVELVEGMLTVDADRAGIEDFRRNIIRQGVIRIQSLVPEFRLGHEVIYHPNDLVVEGHASRGTKPPQSSIRDVWLVKLNSDGKTCYRYPVEQFPWESRFALVNGKASVNGGRALISIDPQGYTFYMYPEVFDCWIVSMFWDGHKLDFQDDELVPFTEMMAGAVAHFASAEITRKVDTDLSLYDSYMGSFRRTLPLLAIDAKEKAGLRSTGIGGTIRCGGRTMSCETDLARPYDPPCFRNPIIVLDADPTEDDVPDKNLNWIFKNRITGDLVTWDAEKQALA